MHEAQVLYQAVILAESKKKKKKIPKFVSSLKIDITRQQMPEKKKKKKKRKKSILESKIGHKCLIRTHKK